jgi:DNA repair protein RadC
VREHFLALYLDGSHNVAAFSVVATGGARHCPVIPREVFQGAIIAGACALLVAHNHPSESRLPSREDEEVTKRLIEAGTLLCIPVLDHIIIAGDSHVSLRERDPQLFGAQFAGGDVF